MRAHGIEAYVVLASSVAVSREHRRAKTDRLDITLLKRAFLGWLRGERGHCKLAVIPMLELAPQGADQLRLPGLVLLPEDYDAATAEAVRRSTTSERSEETPWAPRGEREDGRRREANNHERS